MALQSADQPKRNAFFWAPEFVFTLLTRCAVIDRGVDSSFLKKFLNAQECLNPFTFLPLHVSTIFLWHFRPGVESDGMCFCSSSLCYSLLLARSRSVRTRSGGAGTPTTWPRSTWTRWRGGCTLMTSSCRWRPSSGAWSTTGTTRRKRSVQQAQLTQKGLWRCVDMVQSSEDFFRPHGMVVL